MDGYDNVNGGEKIMISLLQENSSERNFEEPAGHP